VVRDFLGSLATGRLHHAWLLTGPRGVGKAAFARLAARRLLAGAAGPPIAPGTLDVPDGHPVASLLDAGSHPDFRQLERLEKPTGDLARSVTVEQVRGLQALFGSTPFLSPWRVAIIDSIDDLERPARTPFSRTWRSRLPIACSSSSATRPRRCCRRSGRVACPSDSTA
jgi:DNA polymerase-3 subunit delta'